MSSHALVGGAREALADLDATAGSDATGCHGEQAAVHAAAPAHTGECSISGEHDCKRHFIEFISIQIESVVCKSFDLSSLPGKERALTDYSCWTPFS